MKVTLDGAQRAMTPADTLRRVRPFFAAAGISRIGDITDMDRLGIPVAICVRPDSRSLAVDSGKGMTREAAMASAAMEGMERHVCETAELNVVLDSADRLGNCETRLPLGMGAVFDPAAIMPWVACDDLLSGQSRLVPRRCVGLDLLGDDAFAARCFFSTTNGVSAGNTREEAVAGGLYEVIERDATHLAQEAMQRGAGGAVRRETIGSRPVLSLIERIEDAGCGVGLIDCTSDVGVPVFLAWIYDREERGAGVFKGYGAHLSPEIAACRAICEAAQARALVIAGARDDVTHERFLANQRQTEERDWRVWADVRETTDFGRHADLSGSTFRADVAEIMRLLEVAGFPSALFYDFDSFSRCGAHVVRVIIPGLEGYWTPWTARGPRVAAQAAEISSREARTK